MTRHLPHLRAARPLLPSVTAFAAASAVIVASVAGCSRPTLEPKSRPGSVRTIPLQTPGEPHSDASRHRGPGVTGRNPQHPAGPAAGDDLDLPFVRAGGVPGVNVFGEFDGQPQRPFTAVAGRAGYRQHSFVDEGYDADVTVSADGQWMAFASTRHSTRSDIYLQRVDGLAVTKVTTDPADDAFPSFSPDGRRIAFASNRSGAWNVYVMDRDGKNVAPVTSGREHDLAPTWSPDGSRLAFCRTGGRSGQWEIWVADLSTGERSMVGFGLFPAWSPRADRDVIAFQRARQRGGRWFSLWTLELDNGEPTDVTEIAMSPSAALVAPAWSPDGTRIAFATVVDPDAGVPDPDAGRQDIWTINADGSDRRRLTDGRGVYATPFWATDGRVYFISDRGGVDAVWSARATGHNFSTAATADRPAVNVVNIDVTAVER